MKPKGNSIEKRIEIAIQSIQRNKDRKQRREKAEEKLQKLLQLKEELERKEIEKQAEKVRKKEERRQRNLQRTRTRYWEIHTPVYHTNGMVEKEAKEEDMYTKYELEHIEELYPEEKGRLNWLKWNEVVEECRRMFR